MKKNLGKVLISILGLVMIVCIVIVIAYNNVVSKPFSKVMGKQEITVLPGDSLHSFVDTLGNEGILSNTTLSKVYMKINKVEFNLIPGVYAVNKNTTMEQFLSNLKNGNMDKKTDDNTVKVTIPEGYDLEQIADLMQTKGVVSKKDFIAAAQAFPLPSYVVHTSASPIRYKMEGYLFPDTYNFYKNSKASDVVKTLSDKFGETLQTIEHDTGKNITAAELEPVMTIASIVQWEITEDKEKGLAASVFYNRLAIGQKLQSNATTYYALNKHMDYMTDAELNIANPYNTYYCPALPPGPICSPSKASIEATMKPPATKYYYFLSKTNGSYVFSETWEQHQKAIADDAAGK